MGKNSIIHNRLILLLLVFCLVLTTLTGCGIQSQHLEVTYEENNNEDIHNWEDADNDSVTTWDNAFVVTWDDIDEFSDWVYAELLFEEVPEDMPIVECRVLNYQSNGKYFDGEKVYKMVGDKFDVNSFVAKYAIGTGVIVICVVLNVVTAGVSTPITCFIAGAADASVSMAIKGAAFGAATKAIIRAIKSGGDVEEALYLEAIDLMLPGGLQNGNWYFFMDADKQNLYFAHMGYEEIIKTLDEYHSHFANYSLINNCRNSQAIIEKIDSIFGTHTKFRRMEMRGTDVLIRGYKKSQDQVEIVEFILRQLLKEQIPFDDIAILSASRFDGSVASELTFPISTERRNRKGKLLFSTIHSFKGLESPIVILVDFDNLNYDQRMNLLYVGMTRARSALYMVVSDKARQTLDTRIREVAKNG